MLSKERELIGWELAGILRDPGFLHGTFPCSAVIVVNGRKQPATEPPPGEDRQP